MEFYERLRASRKEKGLTQVQLAKIAGVTRETIGNYESGERTPPLAVANKLADALGVTREAAQQHLRRLEAAGKVTVTTHSRHAPQTRWRVTSGA